MMRTGTGARVRWGLGKAKKGHMYHYLLLREYFLSPYPSLSSSFFFPIFIREFSSYYGQR